jgi:hypothetical protein
MSDGMVGDQQHLWLTHDRFDERFFCLVTMQDC